MCLFFLLPPLLSLTLFLCFCLSLCLSVSLSLFLSQVLKLQEAPDMVPNGELPRHLQLYCDRYLTEKVVPGNRVTVVGIYSIKKGPAKPTSKVCGCVLCGCSFG